MIAGTGDVAHARLRRGRSNDATAAPVFIKETIGRLRAAGAAGELVLRMDSGFYLHDVVAACRAARVRFSIGARMIGNLKHVIPAIDEAAWTPIDYFLPGAAVTEICWTPFTQDTRGHDRPDPLPVRLIVRRTLHRRVGPQHRPRRPAGPVPRLRLPPVHHRPRRADAGPGNRPPPPRRGRTGHPRPQTRHGPCASADQASAATPPGWS
ncbi:hypothetical protein GCM10029963_77280 [Micromonospora andamanensis]